MKILIACEYSGRVRDAFIKLGHNAMSCDLLPTESPGPHYQGDVFDIIGNEWDIMIAHPPCTYLCNSGVRWFKNNLERQRERESAVDFVKMLWNAPIAKICIENPIGHLSRAFMKPTQIIQPWQYGHGETKATCLWLKGINRLQPTNIVDGREPKIHHASPGPNRWKIRSLTYQGIADAMAQQWGK